MSDPVVAIRLEQRAAWEEGQKLPLEHFLARYPNVIEDESALLDLICSEMFLRREFEEPVPTEEYVRRFPDFADQLTRLIELASLFTLTGDNTPLPFDTAIDAETRHKWPQIPGVDLVCRIARGSWGTVYEGVQQNLSRRVAVKILDREPEIGTKAAFHRHESETLAKLNHPNIVQIFDSGFHDGQNFILMEYVEGESLSKKLADRGPIPPTVAATLLSTLADGIGFAHCAGVIHRDLKPANILLTSNGVPKIVDFGLARDIGGESITNPNSIVGSAQYMAPELATGTPGGVGAAADIFALGIILHEMLTGHPPFHGNHVVETLHLIGRSETPDLDTSLAIPHGLDLIRRKCLEKNPSDRYATAMELADDIRRFLRGESVVAKPSNRVPRRKLLSGVGIVGLTALGYGFFKLAGSSKRLPPTFEDARAEIIRRLNRGEAYSFNSTTDVPLPFKWKVGDGVHERDPVAGELSVTGSGSTFLELLDTISLDAFQITARIKMIPTTVIDASAAGVYWSFVNEANQGWSAITISYSERGQRRVAGEAKTSQPKVIVHTFNSGNKFPDEGQVTTGPTFTVGGVNGEPDWRRVGVSVTPDAMSLLWDAFGVEAITSTIIPVRKIDSVRGKLHQARGLKTGVAFPFIRGGLGLFVQNCKIKVQELLLKPMA